MRFLRQALLTVLLCVAATAHAADRVALLIGNNDYKDEGTRLQNAAKDAKDLSEALSRLGFKIILRLNANSDAMKGAVREFGGELENASVALFFYAGHALQVQNNNYLLPVDLSPRTEADVLFDGMDLVHVMLMMGERTKKIVILDACRDNPFKDRFRAATGLAQTSAPPDTLIAYATAPGAVSYDGAGSNGTYTKQLLRHIEKPGQDVFQVFNKVGEASNRKPGKCRSRRFRGCCPRCAAASPSPAQPRLWRCHRPRRTPNSHQRSAHCRLPQTVS